ncbi:MAG: vitamin K epoxide reductase family protein [Dehalococcoidia bacterium]|jgi:uncharacterized membrane protein|nr:vitamin K epoxide reductase family protein [Dehalococcoidia bacterium]
MAAERDRQPGRTEVARGIALLALSAAGVAIAAYLSWIAIVGVDSIACGPAGDCHAVQTSEYSKVAGVPVAMLGLAMYIALLAGAVARRQLEASPLARRFAVWTFALALGGTLYSGYLTYVELFVIDAVCAWCVASAVVVTAIFVVALPDVRRVAEPVAAGGRSPASDV